MLINISKQDPNLTLETQGHIFDGTGLASIGMSGEITQLKTLNFEGFAGFNEKYVLPFFKMVFNQVINQKFTTFSTVHVKGNLHNDTKEYEADFFIIKNVTDTQFLFKHLKSLSIILPELRIGYEYNPNTDAIVLYLDPKIIKVLKTLSDDQKQELVLMYYCIVKLCKALDIANPILGTSANGISIPDMQLQCIYSNYGKIPENISIDCISLNADVKFSTVVYHYNNVTPVIRNNFTINTTSQIVYNVLKYGTIQHLLLVNVNTKDFYRIDLDNNVVYTNNELQEYNAFNSDEWMPRLMHNIASCKGQNPYILKYLPKEKLLYSSEKMVYLSNDATKFEALLNFYPEVCEYTKLDMYKGFFQGSTIKFEGVESLESQYADDAYAQELFKQIQPYYADFDLKDLTGIVKGVALGSIFSMLFEGESGTGKSTAARVIASRCGIPFVAINCSTNIEESDLFGSMIPNPEKSSADDPEFIWQDGIMTKAIRNGYICIVEELGFARPGVLGKINSLLDEARQIDLPNGEVLKCHPNFRIIATTNIGYEGTNRLNKALINRFEICKKFVDLEKSEVTEIIKKRLNYLDNTKISKVLDIYNAIKKYSNENSLGIVVSIRQILNIFKQGKFYKDAKDAVTNLLINAAFLEEPDHLKNFQEVVLKAYDLNFKI